jgi:hypothetical protein
VRKGPDYSAASRAALSAKDNDNDNDNDNDDDDDDNTAGDGSVSSLRSRKSTRKARVVHMPKNSHTRGHFADIAEPDGSVTLAFAHPDDDSGELNRLLARHIAMKVQVPLA